MMAVKTSLLGADNLQIRDFVCSPVFSITSKFRVKKKIQDLKFIIRNHYIMLLDVRKIKIMLLDI